MTGSSSKTSTTTGVSAWTAAVCTSTSSGKTSASTFELKRKSTRKTIGAGASTVMNVRHGAHAPERDGGGHAGERRGHDQRTVPSSPRRSKAWTAKTATRKPAKTRWRTAAARSSTSPTRSSTARSAEGGHERDDEREEHDVRRRRAAHGEELGVLPRGCRRAAVRARSLRARGAGGRAPRARGSPTGGGPTSPGSPRRSRSRRDGVVEHAPAAGELLASARPEPLAERALERLAVVVRVRARALAGEQRRTTGSSRVGNSITSAVRARAASRGTRAPARCPRSRRGGCTARRASGPGARAPRASAARAPASRGRATDRSTSPTSGRIDVAASSASAR